MPIHSPSKIPPNYETNEIFEYCLFGLQHTSHKINMKWKTSIIINSLLNPNEAIGDSRRYFEDYRKISMIGVSTRVAMQHKIRKSTLSSNRRHL